MSKTTRHVMPQRNNLLRKTHEGTTDFWMAANYNEFVN